MNELSEAQRRVLLALNHGDRFEPLFFPFKPLAEETGMDIREVRRIVRRLARNGFTEYARGLWNEFDDKPAGAGYCITPAGRAALEAE